MKTYLFRYINLLFCLVVIISLSRAQAPVFNSVVPNTTTPAKFSKFELNIDLTAGYTNPYDYDDIAVQCIFTAPSAKKDTVDGFFMQDYTLDGSNNLVASGTGTFKIRFAPSETGTWSYVVSCTNLSGTASQPAQTFQCGTSASPGFIRKNTTNYLSFDNGNQFIPIGENMGWQNGNVVTDYTNWITKLTDNGGNFIRVWMSDWAFALEWKNGSNAYAGLKKYQQQHAFYLDWLLDYCNQKNVYMMLTLNHHGQVSSGVNPEWSDNPYNAANGGPASNTWEFFTNATAKALHKNRLRYIMARFGYSQNLQAWELFNEVEFTDQYSTHKTDVKDWHQEMANYIKSKDVYQHLVTTSFAYSGNDPATWNIPAIDFTQTHFYVSSPNIESVLSAADQNFLLQYSKPTLNGEFGLGPSGSTLSTDDPNGIHIHNAIWGSMFGGSLGTAMTWWWDDYINPKNLYYHYAPLSSVASLINFKNDDYKKTTVTASGGGAADITISPGAGFVFAPASNFTIDGAGTLSPDATNLSAYMFGNSYNTQYRNPPTFHVTYPIAGQFKVSVTSGGQGTAPKVNIYLDGTEVLNQNVVAGNTYTVNVPGGAHDIKVDNLGTDWFNISSYVLTNVAPPVTSYVLKSASNFKAAGWILNNQYNWQYVKDNGAPAAVQGSSITIPGMQNGTYTVNFYSTSTGSLLNSISAAVNSGQLAFALPDIAWDIAFTAAESSVLPVQLYSFSGEKVRKENQLHIDIAEAANVKAVYIERSPDGNKFSTLRQVNADWLAITGKHIFVDEHPLKGNNFYRLKFIDYNGVQSFSQIIKLFNNLAKFSVYPNPFRNYVLVNIEPGNYQFEITDRTGRMFLRKHVNVAGNDHEVKMPLNNICSGVYFLSVVDKFGSQLGYEKIMK